MIAQVGDTQRIDYGRERMAYLDLVPSEQLSVESRRVTGITKAGSTSLGGSLAILGLPNVGQDWAGDANATTSSGTIRDLAWKAQMRLCARYRRMLARREKALIVITPRELVSLIVAFGVPNPRL